MTAPSLREIQELFWQAITHPTGVGEFLHSGPAERRALFEAVFAETPGFEREERVSVYADAYFYRLHDVLAEVYAMVRLLLGPTRFHNLVTDYLLVHPSQVPDLHALGESFPDFIHADPVSQRFPAAHDLARVELALHHAIDARDDAALTMTMVAALAPGDLNDRTFALVASATLLDVAYNPRPLHDALVASAPPPQLEAGPPGAGVLVWRKGHIPHFRWLAPDEGAALSALQGGAAFVQLCDEIQQRGGSPMTVATYLKRWLSDEVLAEASWEAS